MSEEKFLLYLAEDDVDESEGLTLREMLEMLAEKLGAKIVWPE